MNEGWHVADWLANTALQQNRFDNWREGRSESIPAKLVALKRLGFPGLESGFLIVVYSELMNQQHGSVSKRPTHPPWLSYATVPSVL